MVANVQRRLEDLRAAGAPQFFEANTEVLKQQYRADFEKNTGRTLYPAQTEMFVIELMAYAHSLYNEAAQLASEQSTVVFANGKNLENKGADFSTYRLLAQKAKATVRFALQASRTQDIVVPKGNRVSDGGEAIFITDHDCVIPAGGVYASCTATASEAGRLHNELPAGTINTILDPVAFVVDAQNLTPTTGGSDDEETERFRLRVANALEKIAKTGTRGGYTEFVKEVHPDIVDVDPHRNKPGVIHIFPLMRTGVASEEIKDAIFEYLDPDVRRAMGDYVEVHDPEPITFSPTLIIYVPQAVPDLDAKARQVVFDVTFPWTQKLGAQLAPSEITTAIRQLDGVFDAEISDLKFTDLAHNQFPRFDDWTIGIKVRPNV